MQKHVLWAALISSCVFSALSLSACTEVESCKKGEVGCVDGPAKKDDSCNFNLVNKGGKCVEPGTPGGTGGEKDASIEPKPDAGDDKDAKVPSPCGECEAPALCLPETKTCVNFCETPDEVPGTGESYDLIVCGGDVKDPETMEKWEFDLKQSCTNTCLLVCRWQNWFCEAEIDCAAECAKSYVQDNCTSGCGAEADDAARVACQNKACVDARKMTCVEDASLCPSGKAPKCDDFSCTNECAPGTDDDRNTIDGYCDDGAYIASNTDFCPFGTDCADCGPRKGKARPVDTEPIAFGEPCPNQWRCPGHSSNHDLNKSWCLDVNAGVGRCLVDCSSDDETCPAPDYECIKLNDSNGDPLVDNSGRRAQVCAPKTENLCN